MAATVNFNPNRFGSTVKVLKFDATLGTYSIVDEDHDYTGITYNFAALPAAGATTTTTGTTTGTTTAAQTTQAFGDVRPLFSTRGQGGGGGNGSLPLESEKDPYVGFILPEKKPIGTATELKAQSLGGDLGEEYLQYSRDSNLQARFSTFEEYQKYLHPIRTKFKGIQTNIRDYLGKQWENITGSPFGIKLGRGIEKTKREIYTPGMAAIRAISETYRPGANRNYAGVAGLYEKEIGLMVQYGSTVATQGNPTGDRRKDDAGFNIVSGAGNYNTIGSYSRRSNMIKDYKKEGKTANDARADWKKEKDTGNRISNIDSSGSTPKAPTEPVSVPVPSHISGDGQGGLQDRDQRGDAGKAGGESTSTLGSF